MASPGKAAVGLVVLCYAIIFAGIYFTGDGKPEKSPPSPVSAASAVDASARLKACDALVKAGATDGIIRRMAGHRIEVEEIGWAGLPYHTKQSVLAAVICLQTGGRMASSSDSAAAYGYRSGKRLLMMTGDGLMID